MPGKKAGQMVFIWSTLQRLLQISGKNRYWLYTAVFLLLIAVAITMAGSILFLIMVDAVIARKYAEFHNYLGLFIIFTIAETPFVYFSRLFMGAFSERTLAGLREKIATHLTILPIRYLEERHSGDILSIANSDLAQLQTLLFTSLYQVVQPAVLGIASLTTIFVISWKLGLSTALLIPLMIFVQSKLNRKIAIRGMETQQAMGDAMGVVQDGLGGLLVPRVFNLAGVLDERFQNKYRTVVQKGLALSVLRAVISGTGAIFNLLPIMITYGFGGYLALKGQMTFGMVLTCGFLSSYVSVPLYSLPPLMAGISIACGSARRVFSLLDQAGERTGGNYFSVSKQNETVLQLDHVRFSYGNEPVLRDIGFKIRKGQTFALVGSSGGGKSTLLKLLLGFYPIGEKSIFLFGRDLNDWALTAIRSAMAYVSQDTYLFPVSIAENIACGKPGADPEEIKRAAKMANIHDYIISLPEGYQTRVGERGIHLSGGQRQRLSIARAILKDAPILLLDEPTSALDNESEALVQKALEHFMNGRTTLVIAHRLSTIRRANRVLVLEDGCIVEDGTHHELLEMNGRYRDLYERQLSLNAA